MVSNRPHSEGPGAAGRRGPGQLPQTRVTVPRSRAVWPSSTARLQGCWRGVQARAWVSPGTMRELTIMAKGRAQHSCGTAQVPATGDGRPSWLSPDVAHGPDRERRPLTTTAAWETSNLARA